MSYFSFFCNNITKEYKENESIKGSCYEMCPSAEKKLREKEGLVHVLEVVDSARQLVKSYSRSAADSNMAIPSVLRPYPVLKDTIHHLLFRIIKRNDVSTACLYDFVNDRLRAVRQDMTIQRLSPRECMQLLEPMIRFHVYFGHRLCGSPINEFDPVLNRKYLLECMKWFLHCCDSQHEQTETTDNELAELMLDWGIDKLSILKLSCDKILVECLHLLCNLDDMRPLYRYLSLQANIKSAPPLRLAYEIAIANLRGNFVKVCRLAQKLCPLTYCAFRLYLPVLQRRALQVMCEAYSCRRLSVPARAIRDWLAFDTDQHVVTVCSHYGLTADDAVHFLKGAFKTDVDLFKQEIDVKTKINIPIHEILTYRL